jgi:hypothetical protein
MPAVIALVLVSVVLQFLRFAQKLKHFNGKSTALPQAKTLTA